MASDRISPRRAASSEAPDDLHERLRARRPEIERIALGRISAIANPREATQPEYLDGLRAAVSAAVDYALAGVEMGDQHPPPVPAALLAQARVAARLGIRLEDLLRRYFAGHALFSDFLLEEAKGDFANPGNKSALRVQAMLCDQVLAATSEEYRREVGRLRKSGPSRHVELVDRLLSGQLLDASRLAYNLDAHHLAVIAAGADAAGAIRELAGVLDRRLLTVSRADGAVWAWFGGRRRLNLEVLDRHLPSCWPPEISLAIGEPAPNLGGWRLSHQQALAALPFSLRGDGPIVRYRDISLLAAVIQDDLLTTSLHQLYLEPLDSDRDRGEVFRRTLRAYFAARRNTTSAAASLSVSRNTVSSRLQTIEAKIGVPLESVMAELELASKLDAFRSRHRS